MKKIFLPALLLLALASCNTQYYQICTLKSTTQGFSNERMAYDDENCSIVYNMWGYHGDAGFIIKNKTKQMMFVDLSKCFMVNNGLTYDYFQNRASSSSSSSTKSTSSSSGFSVFSTTTPMVSSFGSTSKRAVTNSSAVSYAQKPIVVVPAGASRYVSEFNISNNLFLSCNYDLIPGNNASGELQLGESDSPLTFTNYITYKIGDNGEEKTVTNSFYVSSIQNISKGHEETRTDAVNCAGERLYGNVMKDQGSNKFYNMYKHSDIELLELNQTRK